MDVREKLIGLIAKAKYICANDYSDHTEDEYIADTLLDSGVIVQEWISVEDRLPETDGIYIVCDCRLNGNPWIHTAGFIKASSSWCELHGVYYDDGYGRYSKQDKITHWMPMPHPPKGGNMQ